MPIYSSRPISDLQWHSCAHGVSGSDCALLTVPLDYSHPQQGMIKIGISRIKAADPQHRIGTLFVNAGGPGASGDDGLTVVGAGLSNLLEHTTDLVARRFLHNFINDFADVRDHFDIIGFDPRGIGRGSRIHCPVALESVNFPMIPDSEASYRALAKHNHRVGLKCEQASGLLLQHIDTRYIADDIDAIRKALGEKTISYYGVSYGTMIGQLYAEKYPSHLRAIVIDGNMNHTESGWLPIVQESRSEEAALQFLDQQCRRDLACHVPHRNVIQSFEGLLQQAGAGKILDTDGSKISARDLTRTLYDMLMTPDAAGFSGVNKFFAHPNQVLDRDSYSATSGYIPYVAVSCQDFITHEPTYNEYHNWIDQIKTIAPHMYRYSEYLNITSACLGWPLAPHDPPSPLHVNPDLPVLMVANRIDPSTPLDYALALHKIIPGSRLLITDAVGHTANFNSHCGRIAIVHYLLNPQLPQHDWYCDG